MSTIPGKGRGDELEGVMSLSVCNHKEIAMDRDHESFAMVSGNLCNCPCGMQVMCKVLMRGVVKGYLVLSR